METRDESICCQEAVLANFLNGEKCISNNENFVAICMNTEVLRMALVAMNDLQGNSLPDNHKSLSGGYMVDLEVVYEMLYHHV